MQVAPSFAVRSLRRAVLCVLAVGLCLLLAAAARAQVVQQPEFNFFSTQTSVLVPDRGGMYMGGIGSSASGSTTRGVPLLGRVPGLNRGFQNQGIGHSVTAGGVSVHATIIDLAEMDRAILESARQGRATLGETAQMNQNAGVLSQHVQDPAPGVAVPLESVAEIRRQQQAADAAQSQQALTRYANAQAAEAEGKYGVAIIHYRTALRDANGPLADEISARIAELESARRSISDR